MFTAFRSFGESLETSQDEYIVGTEEEAQKQYDKWLEMDDTCACGMSKITTGTEPQWIQEETEEEDTVNEIIDVILSDTNEWDGALRHILSYALGDEANTKLRDNYHNQLKELDEI